MWVADVCAASVLAHSFFFAADRKRARRVYSRAHARACGYFHRIFHARFAGFSEANEPIAQIRYYIDHTPRECVAVEFCIHRKLATLNRLLCRVCVCRCVNWCLSTRVVNDKVRCRPVAIHQTLHSKNG